MLQHIRDALLDKLDDQYCAVKWTDTKKTEIIPSKEIQLSPEESIKINVTYTILINGDRRYGTVVATGTRRQCEQFLFKQPDGAAPSSSEDSGLLDDLVLMRIFGKLLTKAHDEERSSTTSEDVHDTSCAACGMKPIRDLDRYHCLICTNHDLCGRCFEKRRETNTHRSGHAMVHLKFPNEYLGIEVDDVHREVTLARMGTLRSEVHQDVSCDGICGEKTIVGLRFKCDTCANYNLCESCAIEKHVSTKSHQRDHPVVLTSANAMPKVKPEEIEFGDVLGRGGFGYVCKGHWRRKDRQVACKVIEVSGNSFQSRQLQRSFLLELAAYRELSGPYILRTYGYFTRDLPSNRIRGSTTQFVIIMELMSRGSLQNVLDTEASKIPLRRKLAMCRQVASGMRRIHQHGMIHRDIRPDNILVNENYTAKIGDMGIARVLDPRNQHTALGCLQFMPPEFFDESQEGKVKCDEKLDIYTFGLTLNQVFTESMHEFRLNRASNRMRIVQRSPILFDELIEKCLDDDRQRRPTAIEIEKTLEFYEQAFTTTMKSDTYVRMSTQEKDRLFLQFYRKNQRQLQRFVQEHFPKEFHREAPKGKA